ncbi:hypothetical protein [Candidatus Venteria ishoeyi]|uniref:Uncharacterized protein n=1 Tax=Candidatus Venteria ishoeyi TaxID=1899563 RepID=A0A1H6FCZ5_9GAMM|nr:hypothetical protein [Candidatus Venteria ishoeyi]SEH07960.1 Uncharacterised protein [Candidatus Venteria ishoeyi]
MLCSRVEELLSGQAPLLEADYPLTVEREAQHIAAQLLVRQDSAEVSAEPTASDMQSVDVESLEMVRPRTVGVESVGLWAMQQIDFIFHAQG